MRRNVRYIAIGMLVVVVAAAILTPRLLKDAQERGRRLTCRANLRQIGYAMMWYAADYSGWGPTIAPRAREIANAVGVPAGSVLRFRNAQGHWEPSGLGILREGGYLCSHFVFGMYCPSVSGNDPTVVNAFTCDREEPFWAVYDGGANANGIGELPGGEAVLCGYVLRYGTGNPQGAVRFDFNAALARLPSARKPEDRPPEYEPLPLKGVISDLLFFGEPGAVRNHEGVYNVMLTDGSVKTFRDDEGRIAEICKGVRAEEIENVIDKEIFGEFFDLLGSKEQP